MAEADSTLEILIKTVLDATGYRMNEAEAQKLKAAIGQTSSASGTANEEDSKVTDKLILKKRELMHVINAIGGQAVPELGRALSTLAYGSGAAGAVFLVVGAFELVRRKIKEAQQATEDFNEAAAKGDFAESAKAAASAMQDALNSQAAYIRNLDEIRRGEHGITVELNNQLQLIAAIQAARQSQSEAERTLTLAKLKEQEVFGTIPESEVIKRRGEIEKKAIEDKAKTEEETFRAQQRERQTVIDEAARNQPALEKARADAQTKLDAANLAKASATDAPKIEDVRKAQAEAEKKLEVFQSGWEIPVGLKTQLPENASGLAKIQQDEAIAAQAKADDLLRLFQQAQRANAVNTKGLEDDLKAKEDAATKNAQAQSKAQDEMANANRTHSNPDVVSANAATRRAAEQTLDIQSATELFSNAQKDIKEITRTAQIKNVSPEDIQQARAAVNDLAQTIRLLPSLLNDLKSLGTDAATIREMQLQIDDLKSRLGRATH